MAVNNGTTKLMAIALPTEIMLEAWKNKTVATLHAIALEECRRNESALASALCRKKTIGNKIKAPIKVWKNTISKMFIPFFINNLVTIEITENIKQCITNHVIPAIGLFFCILKPEAI
jgi:hypothetical protein